MTGKLVTSDPPAPQAKSPDFQHPIFSPALNDFLASSKVLKTTLYFQGFLVLAAVIVLIVQQVQFSTTWNRDCDHNQKVWSTVWISRALLQCFLLFVVSYLAFKKKKIGLVTGLRRLNNVISIFKCVWFWFGIKPVFIDIHCDPTISGTWCLTLWWLEFAAMIAPCVLACCFAPVLVCCLMRGGGSGGGFSMVSEQHFTPEEVRNSLPTIKFSQVSRSSTASKTKTPETQPPPTTNETARIGIYPDMASTLTGLPFPSMDQLGISQAKGKTEIENFDTCQICLNQFQCPICTQNIVHVTEMEKFMDATTGPHNLTPMTESTETHIQKDSQLVEKPESLV